MTLTIRLPEPIESLLTCFGDFLDMSKSQVVQTALKDWFSTPAVISGHTLLGFVSELAPPKDWVGPYSKDRLRAQVLARGAGWITSEPEAGYAGTPKRHAVRRKAAAGKLKNDSYSPNQDKGLEAATFPNAGNLLTRAGHT